MSARVRSAQLCIHSHVFWLLCSALLIFAAPVHTVAQASSQQVDLNNWQLTDATSITQTGEVLSTDAAQTTGWYPATVPGTVLTTLVKQTVYPEPNYGENDRPAVIPDTLARHSYWYRTRVLVPAAYRSRHVWLHFDGINYAAAIWVNGVQVGSMRGAFRRGVFEITTLSPAGRQATIAVLVSPQPHPGVPHEHTLANGIGPNGGVTSKDGPTFLSTIGWDWLPAVRDRDTGLWQRAYLTASGPVRLENPYVTSKLRMPQLDAADLTVQTTLENVSDEQERGVLQGDLGSLHFQQAVTIEPHSARVVTLAPATTLALHIAHPRLWWPNGYGPQNLYTLQLRFRLKGTVSDAASVPFGIRDIQYTAPGSTNDNLTFVVNGVPVFIRGGDWGLDEALKRTPRARLEAEIRLHQLAHLNMIRNWVGQSTSEDFYELCDKYGLLVWDEFFQPSPLDGPEPDDADTYIANVRDKLLRDRNHPSIALWCGRNEGSPPPEIDRALRALTAGLDPQRLYQASSTEGRGVRSGGPYRWRAPREFYSTDTAFKTETGSVSVPTLESVHAMMPAKDWESINDDWAEHDFAAGNSGAQKYRAELAARYGPIVNLADFVQKAQLANYEAFRAMYEGRNTTMFHPSTGVITWMSNPAHPSFVWQIYSYDLEPHASYFATRLASEPIHVQRNEVTGTVQVINNTAQLFAGEVHMMLLSSQGALLRTARWPVHAAPSAASDVADGAIDPVTASSARFVALELQDSAGGVMSRNVYWLAQDGADDLTWLAQLPRVPLQVNAARLPVQAGSQRYRIVVTNPGDHIALMAHFQLREKSTGARVLPVFYSDNYLTLLPHTTRVFELETNETDLHGDSPVLMVDGPNVDVTPATFAGISVAPNTSARADAWPATGLPTLDPHSN